MSQLFFHYLWKKSKHETGIYRILFLDDSRCFANAQSWKEITRFSPQQTIQKIRFLTSELGYCVSSLYNGSTMNIHKTTNGGLSWTDQSSGYSATRFMDIFILNEQTAFHEWKRWPDYQNDRWGK
ncbi:MAG: hypothetical protein IPG21_17225 [Saprospiraceae bacterium]|nr:hypothetical protein [Candidatus Vicinibacter affinis]